MRRPKNRRFSKRQQFDHLYQILRYALATRTPLFHVAGVRDKLLVTPESPSAFVVLEILGLPLSQGRQVKGSLSARRVAEFFRDWKIQQEFIEWYAKRIASRIPPDSSLKALKRKLAKLTIGRSVTLPPRIYLNAEYQKLIAEIGSLHERFGKHLSSRLTKEQSDKILKFGTDRGDKWVEFVKKREIYLAELFDVPTAVGAKLILSKQYGCKEASIHDGLFRRR